MFSKRRSFLTSYENFHLFTLLLLVSFTCQDNAIIESFFPKLGLCVCFNSTFLKRHFFDVSIQRELTIHNFQTRSISQTSS